LWKKAKKAETETRENAFCTSIFMQGNRLDETIV
jgi:hypothetical protein